ncbi:kelch-like protein 5 isoform X2 [Artemia franciscana]
MDPTGVYQRHSSIGIPARSWIIQSGPHTNHQPDFAAVPRRAASDFNFSSLNSQSGNTSPDGKFVSDSHTRNCMKRMEYYLKTGVLTDIVLVAENKRISAHRVILSAASDYFDAMFTSDVREANQTEVEIRQVDPDALQSLVQYCYTGLVEIQEDNVEGLLAAACLLQLSPVVDECCIFLIKQLHPSNCLGIKIFADAQSCTELFNVAENFTADHFMEVIKNQEFLALPCSEVIKLLSSDNLNVFNEEAVFQAMVAWIKHDLDGRKQHLCTLLSLIKLPQLTPHFIADHIETEPLFRDDYGCQDLIREALMFHLLPERRYAFQSPRTRPRKSTMGCLYLLGWMDSNKGSCGFEKYSPRLDAWTHLGVINGRRLLFGAAAMDHKIFVVGGRDGLKTLASMESFDPKLGTWTILSPMTTHRHGLGVAILGGPLYAVGGHDGWSFLNTVERWDPVSKQWSLVAPMNSPRSTAGVAVLNGKLYAVGGRDSSSCLKTVECYDPHTDRWTMVAPMNKRRGRVGVGVMNNCLYAFGGHDAPGTIPASTPYDCIERYDPITDSWTVVATMSIGRDGAGVCALGDKIYIVSGHDGTQCLNLVETFDPATNTVEQVAPLLQPRAGACVVAIRPC